VAIGHGWQSPALDGTGGSTGSALGALRRWAGRRVPLDQRVDLRHRLGHYLPWEEGIDLTPPIAGPDEVIGPPDYVGIGGTRAGAPGWHRRVLDHPDVSDRRDLPPARHYLSHFATDRFGPEHVLEYHRWFPRRPETITGEWTPSYSSLPWVPALLARAAPDARLLMMVRNPVERFRLAFAGGAEYRVSQAGTATAEAVERGFYGAQLGRVLEHTRRGRILVLQYEQCRADPDGQLAATYRFLGLDDAYRPDRSRSRVGSPAAPGLDAEVESRLVDLYRPDVAALAALVPTLDLSLWPQFSAM